MIFGMRPAHALGLILALAVQASTAADLPPAPSIQQKQALTAQGSDLKVTLSVEKLKQQVDVTLHVPGNDIHAECSDENMYSAIDLVADKLDRQVLKHKEKLGDHHRANGALKHQATN